jgi:hypothetical protein
MKPKVKQPPSSHRKKTMPPGSHRAPRTEEAEVVADWKASIDRLTGESFSTVHDAIDAVVMEVLRDNGATDDVDAKDFLLLLFESDPTLQDTVQRLLVRGKHG